MPSKDAITNATDAGSAAEPVAAPPPAAPEAATTNKGDLIDAVADATGLTKTVAGKAVDAVFNIVQSSVAKGQRVVVTGFGTFAARGRTARTGRNPKTGEPIAISARRTPTFKPGAVFKRAVQAALEGSAVEEKEGAKNEQPVPEPAT